MMKWLFRISGLLILFIAVGLLYFRITYGGGELYPNISTKPTVSTERLTAPIQLPYPPGMVASSPEGRLFYTYHMLHKPERFVDSTIFEWVDGKGVPFPNKEIQGEFKGAMGVSADRQGRLWIVIPGALEGEKTRLLAVDMANGTITVDHYFGEDEAGFAQDMRVSPDGKTVYLADTGLFRFSEPSLIVYDVATKSARTVLKGHPSVSPQDWIIRKTDGKSHKLVFGLLSFVVGVDGLALSAEGDWLYYATMSHDSLYRIPTTALLDTALSDEQIAKNIEFISKKPLSDAIELLPDNTVIITDIENGGLAAVSPDGKLTTLTNDPKVDWADSVTVAPDGTIWYTDSRLTDLIDQFAAPSGNAEMQNLGPYSIYRITPENLKESEVVTVVR